jgi:hypothetical protein
MIPLVRDQDVKGCARSCLSVAHPERHELITKGDTQDDRFIGPLPKTVAMKEAMSTGQEADIIQLKCVGQLMVEALL